MNERDARHTANEGDAEHTTNEEDARHTGDDRDAGHPANDRDTSRTVSEENPGHDPEEESPEREVFLVRAFRERITDVWQLWTEPDLLAAWFGPAEVHVDPVSVLVEPRPGGRWELDMVDNRSAERYPLRARLVSLVPPNYLEGVQDTEPGRAPSTVRLRVWLEEEGATTVQTIRQGPLDPQAREAAVAGWTASFLKADAVLASRAP